MPEQFRGRNVAYNKFAYNLKQCDSKVQALWRKKGSMQEDQLKEFMTTIASTQRGHVTEEWLNNCRNIIDIKESGEEGGWEPWRQVAALTGEEELKAMIKITTPWPAGEVQSYLKGMALVGPTTWKSSG